jgi:hypothetical protein
MRPIKDKVIKEALEFAARWGFITRNLFFEFICPMSRTHRYRYWSLLLSEGLIVSSRLDPLVCNLSKKGRMYCGALARSARQFVYIEHDQVLARLFLSLQKREIILRSWLEDELMRNPMDAYVVLGAERLHRIPDLVFDLKSKDGFIRFAVEVERTTKSQSRYSKMALAYLGYSRVSVVLFGCGAAATETAIQRAFSGKTFIEKKRVPGVFQYDEFSPQELNTKIRFNNMELELKEFLTVVSKAEVPALNLSRDKNGTAVPSKPSQKLEAA